MEESLEQRVFKEAATSCGDCKNYCEEKNLYSDNVYSRQALISLGEIKDSSIARGAEEVCRRCDYKSMEIISFLESYGIKAP